MKKTLTLTELADYIGIPKRTLFDMIRDGRFPVQPVIRVTPRIWSTQQVDEWLSGGKGDDTNA
jgi:excisionase family DNA binding protein